MLLTKIRGIALNHGRKKVQYKYFLNISENKKGLYRLIQKHPTPFFVADKKLLTNRLDQLKSTLDNYWKNNKVAYSFKTNYEIAKSHPIKNRGCWAEVVSGKEYKMAKKIGFKGPQIIFNGPYKTDNELNLALKDGAMVFIDNLPELRRIIKIARLQPKLVNIGLRVNTKISYLAQSRFGFSIDNNEARDAIKIINSSGFLNLSSFHIHLGSDIDNPMFFKEATDSLCNFIRNEVSKYTTLIKTLDFGGGFPAHGLSPYGRRSWNPQPIEKYIKAITNELKKNFPDNNQPTLILEPGRYIADDAVILITRVIANKTSYSQHQATVDATVNMLPLVWYRPQIVQVYNSNLKLMTNKLNTKIYGSSCQEDDLLYSGYLPSAKVGDYLIFYCVGAYNETIGSEFIFDKPPFFYLNYKGGDIGPLLVH